MKVQRSRPAKLYLSAGNGDEPYFNREPKLTVETVENHLYFYSDIDSDRSLDLLKQLRELDVNLRGERLSRFLPDDFPNTPIWLHINSAGGDLYDALSVADQIKQINTPIYSIVEGLAASGATILSMACTKRYIQPSAFMMIHQLSSEAWGTFEQIKDEVKSMEMAMLKLTEFYVKHSKFTAEEIEALLKRDSWFDAPLALKKGLVDEILR